MRRHDPSSSLCNRSRTDRAAFVLLLAAASGLAPFSPAAGSAAGPQSPPARLAETGLYSDFTSRTVAPDVLSYSPQYPLWSDGASKRRWIRIPTGGTIDASDPDAWIFPVGTRIWKEFSFLRRVETRFMERRSDGLWTYATYLWNEDESDASLAPERGVRAAYLIRPGVAHDLPGRYDCLACHEGNVSPVLGFAALQLSGDRDELAPNGAPRESRELDLAMLAERGLLEGLPAELLATPPRITAPTPQSRAALGYLHGNCSSCHNSRGALASLGFSLEVRLASGHGESDAPRTAISHPSRFRPPGGDAVERIVGGDPEHSVLVRRLASRDPLVQMPPFGTHLVDEVALARVVAWIRQDLVVNPERTSTRAGSQSSNLSSEIAK